MLRKIFNIFIVLPLAILLVAFAVANRHLVTLSFDPFNSSDPAFGLSLPLFLVIIGAAVFGVVAGGMAVWFGQHHWRKAARRHEADARAARAELVDLRNQTQIAGPARGGPGRYVPAHGSAGLPAIPAPQ